MKIKTPKPQPLPPPPPPAPLPTEDDATVAARRAAALKASRGRRGRGSTLLSGGSPLNDSSGGGYKPLLS